MKRFLSLDDFDQDLCELCQYDPPSAVVGGIAVCNRCIKLHKKETLKEEDRNNGEEDNE